MILVSGPYDSGKTITLYTGINLVNKEDSNISTAEYPVEINLPGINQVQVDWQTNMTHDKILKSLLRQSPDIILLDQIDDWETANIAIKIASNGRCLVMSGFRDFHDAPHAFTRLINQGISTSTFAFADGIRLIIAQRLVRCLCDCKIEQNFPEAYLLSKGFKKEEIPELKLYGAKQGGCDKCGRSGYKGRTGIFQVMPISEEMRQLIIMRWSYDWIDFSKELAEPAHREGIADLRESGLKKVKRGITSLDEVNHVVPKNT